MTPFGVAVSPCPNDSVIFAAWALGLVGDSGWSFARFFWEDVQTLNEWAAAPETIERRTGVPLRVVKLSAAAALALPPESGWTILDAGAAFGLGAGPKLAIPAGGAGRFAGLENPLIAIPGAQTTAAALLRQAMRREGRAFREIPMSYEMIAGAVASGLADAGVLIHETALVVERHGLELAPALNAGGLGGDLGDWWARTHDGLPLPLGVIAARGTERETGALSELLRESLRVGRERKAEIWPLVKALARELDDETIERHVAAYVTPMTESMGEAGRAALRALAG